MRATGTSRQRSAVANQSETGGKASGACVSAEGPECAKPAFRYVIKPDTTNFPAFENIPKCRFFGVFPQRKPSIECPLGN